MTVKASPRISVVMIDGSFRENFHSVDCFAKQTLPASEFELLWVEYYAGINHLLQKKISEHPNFRAITLGKDGTYHSSYCFNAGIVESRGELLVVIDADVIVEGHFLETVLETHRQNDQLAMYVHRYNELEENHIPEIRVDHLRDVCRLTNPSNYGGCLTVRKGWLLRINGYEQHPVFRSGDHANGLDVYTRLKNLGLHVKWHPQLKLYHPWHPGTLALAPAHKMQHMVIEYRALNLATMPFQGIDPAKESEPPAELMDRVMAAMENFKGGKTDGFCLRLAVREVNKVIRKIMTGHV